MRDAILLHDRAHRESEHERRYKGNLFAREFHAVRTPFPSPHA